MRLLRARAAVALERRGEITRERHEIALGKMVLYENDGIDNKKDKTVNNKKNKLSSQKMAMKINETCFRPQSYVEFG